MKRSTTDHKDGLRHGEIEMDDASDSVPQGQSLDDSSGERPKTLAVATIGSSGDSRAHQVRSVHCPDSGQAEQSRGVTVECDGAVAADESDIDLSSSSAHSGMTVFEEVADESSAPSRVALAQLADSAKCHGDKILQSGSLIHQPHKKGKVPTTIPTSESTVQDNQDQDQDSQVHPNGKISPSVNATNLSTLESTKKIIQDRPDKQIGEKKAGEKLVCRKSTSLSCEKDSNWTKDKEKSRTVQKPKARPRSVGPRLSKEKENLSTSEKAKTPMKLAAWVAMSTKNSSRKRTFENELDSEHASKSPKHHPEKNIAQVEGQQRTVRGVNLDIKASEVFMPLGKKKSTISKSTSSSHLDSSDNLKKSSKCDKLRDNKCSNKTQKVLHVGKTPTSNNTNRKEKCTEKGTKPKSSIPVQDSSKMNEKKSSSKRINEKQSSKSPPRTSASRISKVGSTKDSPIDISFDDDSPIEKPPTSIFVLDNSFHIPRKGRTKKITHIESAKPTYNLYPNNVCNPIFTNDQVQLKHEIVSMLPQECSICRGILCVGSKLYLYTKVDETDVASTISSALRFLPKAYFDMYKASQGKDAGLHRIDVSQRKVVSHICDQVIGKIRTNFTKECMNEKASTKIQSYLSTHLKINEDSFDEKRRYYWLVNRIRMFSFMLFYNMPIQRCYMPTSAKKRKYKHTWGKHLSSAERDVLGKENYELSSTRLLDDIFPPEHPLVHKQEKEPEKPQPTIEPVQLCSEIRGKLSPEYEKFLGKYERRTFTHIKNSMKDEIFSKVCTFVVKKRARTKYNIEYAMAFLEEYGCVPIRKVENSEGAYPNFEKWLKKFLELLIFENPVWDLGIQYDNLRPKRAKDEGIPSISICPCSSFFDAFYTKHDIRPTFFCDNITYKETSVLLKHIMKESRTCGHHRIVLDAIQFLYPELHSEYYLKLRSEYRELVRKSLTTSPQASVAMKMVKESNAKRAARHGTSRLTSSFEIDLEYFKFNRDWQDEIVEVTDTAHYFTLKHNQKMKANSTYYTFGLYNVFKKKKTPYKELEQEENWRSLVNFIKKNGLRMESKKRNCAMYSFGSTVGPANFPRFEYEPDLLGILPRPYAKSKPGKPMYDLYQQKWFQELVQTIAKVTLHFLTNDANNNKCPDRLFALHAYHRSLKILPECVRICGTVFTNVTLTTVEKNDKININLQNRGDIHPHKDEDDIVTAMLHIGNVTKGGVTLYYDGTEDVDISNISKRVRFEHGRLTIGPFHKVMHGATPVCRGGEKYAINFIMKKSVYDHFDKYGDIFYSQLIDREYESNGLIATLPLGFSFKS